MNKEIEKLALAFLLLLFANPVVLGTEGSSSVKPNVVLIVIDDAALMDLGVYGGEAATPTIDMLARSGAMFRQYRTSPLCSPTRAMLLSGTANHLTGVATIPEVLPAEHEGKPGYEMALNPKLKTVAERLQQSGYRTLMSGKWHLGETVESLPNNHGFDRSLALAASGADNWEDKSYLPYYQDAPWFEDGSPVDLPEDFYSSKYIVDKMMSFLEETTTSKPFFAYLPFQAIHIPVQAPDEFIKKYTGVYDQGWEYLKAKRHESAQKLGLIRKGAPAPGWPDSARNWSDLDVEEQKLYSARMEVNAAMLEAMDFHIKRFIDYLKNMGQFKNTIFIVTSDNGAEPSRGDNDVGLLTWMWFNDYHVDIENIGDRGSWGFIGTEWALAASSPSALYKFYATEGGIRAPLIISGPGVTGNTKVDGFAMVTDVAPTIIDLIGLDEQFTEEVPLTGRSLKPLLDGSQSSVYESDEPKVIEVSGNTAVYMERFKLTRSMPPVGDGNWYLFQIENDPGETTPLNGDNPAMMRSMLKAYEKYASEVGVLEMPKGFDSNKQIALNTAKKLISRNLTVLTTLIVLTLLLIVGYFFRRSRVRRTEV